MRIDIEAEMKKGFKFVFVCPICNYTYDQKKEAGDCCGGEE